MSDSTGGVSVPARGVVFVHSCPRALVAHVEWALTSLLGPGTRISWDLQPVLPGTHRCEVAWRGRAGTAAAVASELRSFPGLRFEVTQDPGSDWEGERYCCTPSLGIFRSAMGPHGDVVIAEDRLRSALARSADGDSDLADEVRALLGTAWDTELEPFRYAGDGTSVRVLHRVG